MLDLDAFVVRERLKCDEECSYQLRLKRYRDIRKSLGELNELAETKERPTVLEAHSQTSATTTFTFQEEESRPRFIGPLLSELGKRVGVADDSWAREYQSKVRSLNPEGDDESFTWIPRTPPRPIPKKDTTIEDALNEYGRIKAEELIDNIKAYEEYRKNAREIPVIRASLDEYYKQLRDNIGELENLR